MFARCDPRGRMPLPRPVAGWEGRVLLAFSDPVPHSVPFLRLPPGSGCAPLRAAVPWDKGGGMIVLLARPAARRGRAYTARGTGLLAALLGTHACSDNAV